MLFIGGPLDRITENGFPVRRGSELAFERAAKPRAGEPQLMSDHVNRAADRQRDLLGCHPAEVVHLDRLGEVGVLTFEPFERPVQVEQLELFGSTGALYLDLAIPRHARLASPALAGGTRARVIDQDLTHHPRHERQKVCPVGDVRFGVVEQLEERFVDQGGGLERMSRGLALHEGARNPPQLAVDERHQLVEGGSFPRT